MVPRSGWTASCPPSATADGPRAAGVVGPGGEAVAAALAVGGADRVDRRQVHDVEAEVGDVAQVLDGALSPPKLRGNSSYQAACPARGRSTQSGCGGATTTAGRRARRRPARRRRRRRPPPAGPRACSSSRRTPSAAARRRFFALAPGDLGREVLEDARALLQLELDVLPGGRLHLDLVAPGGVAIGPRVDHQLVEPDGRRRDRTRPPVVVARAAAAPTPSCGRPCAATAPGHRAGRGRRPPAGPTPAPAHRPRPWPGSRRGCGGGRRRSRSASARASSVRAFGIRTAYPLLPTRTSG